jgi:hypothetical protein
MPQIRVDLATILRDWHELVYYGLPTQVGPKHGNGSTGEYDGSQLAITNKNLVEAMFSMAHTEGHGRQVPFIREHIRLVCRIGGNFGEGLSGDVKTSWKWFADTVLANAAQSYKSIYV